MDLFRYTVCFKTIPILEVWGVPRSLSSSCEGLGGPSGPFRDLSIDYTESYTMDWAALPCRSMGTYDKRDLCLDPLWIFGLSLDRDFSLDNWPGYLITARGGLYASLFDGIRMTTYVCNILCAIYNIPTTQGKSIFFGAYMVFL